MLGLLPITRWQRTSLAALILANVVPLIGVLAFEWDLYGVMVLYWAENAIIGLYNVLKMVRIGGAKAVPLALFFCVHYGGFMFVHFVFVKKMFGPPEWGLFPGIDQIIDALRPVASSLLATIISHGISFYVNFLKAREYERTSVDEQMHAPYKRMAVLHITLIVGGWVIMETGAAVGALVVFVVLKTGLDAWSHLREHGRLSAA